MNKSTEDFLKELEQLFHKHKASVAFVGNRITWYVGDDKIMESGNSSNKITIWKMINGSDA